MQTAKEAKKRVQKSRTQAKAQRQGRHAASRGESRRLDSVQERKENRQRRKEQNLAQREKERQLSLARIRTHRLIRSLIRLREDQELDVLVSEEAADRWFEGLQNKTRLALGLANGMKKALDTASRQLSGKNRRVVSPTGLVEANNFWQQFEDLEKVVKTMRSMRE